MTIWEVMADADRERWTYVPSVSVGPLRFGMSPAEAAAAMAGFTATLTPIRPDNVLRAEFRRAAEPPSSRGALAAYFVESDSLFCVVVDAQSGPQVTIDGVELVGRVPSRVEAQLLELMTARGFTLRYQWEGNPEAEELGLSMRVQRAGDVVLTRPVFAVFGDRAATFWDIMPSDELKVH
ncbi:hypothetical protein ACFQS1_03805 [Paractinoplanes rhizophilus]|uniref:Uncharacterized protein n=1 Tax=Paractinoplanes rhizophilus TaxID=1416877 RepID=A0ABW2HIT6_9ACTN